MLATWMTGALINVLAYRFGRWRKKAQLRMAEMASQSEEAASEVAAADIL